MKKLFILSHSLLFGIVMFTFREQALAQTGHTVTGKILDENGSGYSGAIISVKNMHIKTLSDINGDFMLDVPDDDNIFIIQATGYDTMHMKETDGTITVKLQPVSIRLEGEVRTVQAIEKENRTLGYTTTTLNYDDITSANTISVVSGLEGKIAGANITSSTNGPGGSVRVVLRGEKSVLNDNNALIVIDGVIMNNYDRTLNTKGFAQVDFGNSANDIDPEEIESVTVLQGPAATALYGSAGAHGALIYTTKKGKIGSGKSNKLAITYKTSYTQSDVLKYADLQHQYGQGDIYSGDEKINTSTLSWGAPFDGSLRPWGQIIDGKQLVKPYVDQPDNIKSFFNHGKDLNNFLSLSDGTEKSSYFFSLNSLNSTGVIPNTFYNKYSVRFNGTTQLSNNFYSSVDINYLNTYSRAANSGEGQGSVMGDLNETPRDIPVSELKDYTNKFYSMQFADTSGKERYGAYSKNPYWDAENYKNINKSDRILGDVKLGYKKGDFNIYDRLGADVSSDRSSFESPQFNVAAEDATYATNTFSSPGSYSQSTYNRFNLYNDLVINYTHQLNRNFGINAVVGENTTMQHYESLSAGIDSLVIPNYYNFSNNSNSSSVADSVTNRRTVGIYSDVTLNFQKEIYLNITARNDWSSTLLAGQNSNFYPAANAAWIFTERLKGTTFKDKILNYGKIRLGAGGAGSDALPYANNNGGYTQSTLYNGTTAYQVQSTLGDNNLKPEKTREFETGVDLSFFKDRISFSFTYYNSLTTDFIAEVPVAASSGYSYAYSNIGTISNKGEELTVRGTPISTKWGLKWELFGTYTHNVNNVVSLNGDAENIVISGSDGMQAVAAVGHPYGTFYTTDFQYWNGHVVVDQATGLPKTASKEVYQGSYQPKFQASWGTSLTFKGLKLYVLFVTKQGGQFYSADKMEMDASGTSQETTVNNRNTYIWSNSVYQVGTTNTYLANTTKFSPYTYYTATEQQIYSQGLVDASYIKLKEIALSYKIPQKYYRRSPLGGLETGVFGNNLLLWTAKSNKYNDPEESTSGAISNAQGSNYGAQPSLRSYGAFVKVTF